jgi:NodT family efflux transporter outer membrane factor (OMF) lipoprotein
MRLHLLAAVTALALALTACVSGGGLHPDGTSIDPASLQSGHSLAGVQLSAAVWPSADWWQGLDDPQLDALMREALRDNPGLGLADARARAAQAAAGSADAARGPDVTASAGMPGARLPGTVLPGGHFKLAKYGYVSFAWGLDLWGGKRAAWQAALGTARVAQIEARAARIELSGNVARAYAELGYAFRQQDLGKAELDRAKTSRELTRQRVAAGIDNRIQLRRSDIEVDTATQRLAQATRAIDAARSSLAVLLGKGPDRGLDVARPRLLRPRALAVPTDLPVDLLGHRADLVAARWRVEASRQDIKAAKAAFMPNVSIGALAGVIALGGGNPLSLPARFYQAGPSISLPLFDGGRLRAQLSYRDAQYDIAVAQYNQTLVGALNQVADEVSALQSLHEQIAAQRRAQDAAADAWHMAQQRYRAGIGNYLESLDVRRQLLAAEQTMAVLQARQVDLSVQLIEALGGGFQPQAGTAAPSPTPTRS